MFWRRGGSRFDDDGNSIFGWVLRILIVILITVAAFVVIRLMMPRSEAAEIPYAADAGWKGEKVCELLFENDDARAMRCIFPPGVGHERHYHPPHFGYILKGGTMRITDANGTRDVVLKDGATWWSDGVAWHEALNIGDATSVYLIVEPKGAAAAISE